MRHHAANLNAVGLAFMQAVIAEGVAHLDTLVVASMVCVAIVVHMILDRKGKRE